MQDYNEQFDEKFEKQQQDTEDIKIKHKMFNDLEFCAEQCGAEEVLEELNNLINRMNCYGHEISVKEFIENSC